MYKVILVDDEPVTFKSIHSIMEKQPTEFEIVELCSNGLDGLEAARKWKPDVVITDVKMPVMDGIELARHIQEELPDTMIVILSGYQEFEYARQAITYGVCEYLLKPIIPSRLIKTMDLLRDRLKDLYWRRRSRVMQVMCRGGLPEEEEVKKYFSDTNYYMVLVRKNGLPERFTMKQKYELFSIRQEQIIMYGRDVQEGLYLYPEEILTRPFRFRVEEIAEKYRDGISYITVVASEKSYSIEHVAGVIPLFYRTIAERTVVGKSQILFLENLQEKHVTTEKEPDYLTEILRFLRTNKYEYIPGCVKSILQEWARQEKPQLWFEGKVRQLLYVLIAEGYLQTSIEETEFILEEAFMNATSMAELEENILSVIYKNRKETEDSEQPKLDSPEYFQKIREYIWKNMAEPMTLQQVCREFGISQPYLSRFFKKYEGQSFSNYLAEIRIQRAKELLKANQDLLIKDIAYMVGYTDQFYFSRVFHSVAGLTPTEYVLNQ